MRNRKHYLKLGMTIFAIGLFCVFQSGCSTFQRDASIGVGGAVAVGAYPPTSDIEQIYYLGVFDPREQIPPSVYRVRVKGQASFMSWTKFGTGWVPASLIDTIGTNMSFGNEDGKLSITKETDEFGGITTGRGLMLFGPEGFRPAPRDHRLVMVMGSSPDEFFNAIDQSLGVIAEVRQEQLFSSLNKLLFEALSQVKAEKERLGDLENKINEDLVVKKGAQ